MFDRCGRNNTNAIGKQNRQQLANIAIYVNLIIRFVLISFTGKANRS